MRVLFVSNGHGEMAIAARVAAEVRGMAAAQTDHLALVGVARPDSCFGPVGPQRALPSGGLVAMGNVAALARDVASGFLSLWLGQRRFLLAASREYHVVVGVGDAYCLWMALAAKRPTVFVGTAKSVHVAPYGPFERATLRRAARVFVRDRATADELQTHGVAAHAPGNVIADLAQSTQPYAWTAPERIVVLPGSRADAYDNAARIGRVLAGLPDGEREVVVSVAAGIDAARILAKLAVPARPWEGDLGGIFAGATLAFGQAGTANEAAAAAGLPVVALADPLQREDWYRMRQRRLLDGALALISPDAQAGAAQLRALLGDAVRLAEMSRIGRERMGSPGAARAIAAATVEVSAE